MGILKKIFTWWDGATVGTLLFSAVHGTRVGEDYQGNVYYEGKPDRRGFARRWVIYNGPNDSSRVPPEWHGWLHHTHDVTPESGMPPAHVWEKDYVPNQTGTANAYKPMGALEKGGARAMATGDYEAWSPDAS